MLPKLRFLLATSFLLTQEHPSWAETHARTAPIVTSSSDSESESERAKRDSLMEDCREAPSKSYLDDIRTKACQIALTGKSPLERALELKIQNAKSESSDPETLQQDLARSQSRLAAEQRLSPIEKMTGLLSNGGEVPATPRRMLSAVAQLRMRFQSGYYHLDNSQEICDELIRELSPHYEPSTRKLAELLLLKRFKPQDCSAKYPPEEITQPAGGHLNSEEVQAMVAYGSFRTLTRPSIESIIDRSELWPHMTPVQSFLVTDYTRDGSDDINGILRGENTQVSPADLAPLVKVMNEGLSKLKAVRETVYRGIDLHGQAQADFLALHKVGNIVKYPAYTSTSRGGPVYGGNLALRIRAHQGFVVDKLARYTNEREVIFPAGTCFKVLAVKPTETKNEIELEEVRCPRQ